MSKMTDDIQAWLLSFGCGKKWFNTIAAARTKEMYSKDLKQYCDAVGKNPDELLELKVEGLRNVATDKEFQAEDLLDYYLYNTPDVTEHVKVSILCAVKSFYKANWRELNSNVGKNLSLPEPKRRTPKIQDLVDMDDAMVYQRDKAILWFLESAPFRQGTLRKLVWRDLKSTAELLKQVREESQGQIKRTIAEDEQIAKRVPYYLVIEADRMKGAGRGKYRGVKQVAFLHNYAVEKLEKYKLELKKYGIEPNPDSPLFVTLAPNNRAQQNKGDRLNFLNVIFTNACSMAWDDENKTFSPQDMRDVLQSALEKVEANPNLISPLLGHKVKGVDKHYSNHDIDEFLQVFDKALPLLIPQSVEQVKAETQAKLDEEQKRLINLEYENTDLKQKVNTLTAQQGNISAELKQLRRYVYSVGIIESSEDVKGMNEKMQELLYEMFKDKDHRDQAFAQEQLDEIIEELKKKEADKRRSQK